MRGSQALWGPLLQFFFRGGGASGCCIFVPQTGFSLVVEHSFVGNYCAIFDMYSQLTFGHLITSFASVKKTPIFLIDFEPEMNPIDKDIGKFH